MNDRWVNHGTLAGCSSSQPRKRSVRNWVTECSAGRSCSVAIRHELGRLLGVPVDVLTPKALPDKFRSVVLAEAIPI